MWHQAGVYSADCGIGENQLPWKVSGLKCAFRDPAVRYRWCPRAASAVNARRRRVLQSSKNSR